MKPPNKCSKCGATWPHQDWCPRLIEFKQAKCGDLISKMPRIGLDETIQKLEELLGKWKQIDLLKTVAELSQPTIFESFKNAVDEALEKHRKAGEK